MCLVQAQEEKQTDELKSMVERKDEEITQLKSDMKQLKKKIVQLTKLVHSLHIQVQSLCL